MAQVAFDTLKVARRLADAGLDPETAEGVSEVLADVLVRRDEDLATKSDIAVLQSQIELLGANLRTEMRTQTYNSLRWGVGAMIAALAVLFAAIKLV